MRPVFLILSEEECRFQLGIFVNFERNQKKNFSSFSGSQ